MKKKIAESNKCFTEMIRKGKTKLSKNLINLDSKLRIVNSAWNEIYFCSQDSFLIAYAN